MAVVTELVTKFGFEGSTSPLESYNKSLGKAIKKLTTYTMAAAGVYAAGSAMLGLINRETAQMASLAEAVGLTTQEYQAYQSVSKQIGLSSDVVIDLVEEMNNKFGESNALLSSGQKILPAVSDAMGMLGLKYKDIADLDPGAQFRAVSKAISDMPDAQRAASAADILFGGEANKFFANMKKTGQSLDMLTKKYEAINFLSKDGTKGAKAYSQALGDMGMMFGSIGREVSGVIGGQLTPGLKSVTDSIAALISENKEWIVGIATKTIDIVIATGGALKRLSPILIAGATYWAAMSLAAGGFATIMGVILSPVTLTIAAIAAAVLIIDDLIVAFQGGNSVIADFAEKFLGLDIRPPLQAMVTGVKWAVDQMILGFKIWFDWFADKWAVYQSAISKGLSFFGIGDDEDEQKPVLHKIPARPAGTIDNDRTRGGGYAAAAGSGGGRVNHNKVENTTSITIQTTNASEAKAGVDNALQDQMRNTETALNRID